MRKIRVYAHLFSGETDSLVVEVEDDATAEEIEETVSEAKANLYETWWEFETSGRQPLVKS